MSAAATPSAFAASRQRSSRLTLRDQRPWVDRRLRACPSACSRAGTRVVALERVGGVVAPELHEMRRSLDRRARRRSRSALQARAGCRRGGTLNQERRPTIEAISSLLAMSSHQRCASITAISQRLGGVRMPLDPVRAHAEALLGVPRPDLAGGAGGEADALVDELRVPRLADAEHVHGADLHVRHHLRRRHHDGLDVEVGVDAAGGEPVAEPQIVRAAGEGHRRLDAAAAGLLGRERRLQRRTRRAATRVSAELVRRPRCACASRLRRARICIGTGWLFCVTVPSVIR